MKAVRTVDDKEDALKKRKEEQRKLGKHIDNLLERGVRAQEGESIGCAGQGVLSAWPQLCKVSWHFEASGCGFHTGTRRRRSGHGIKH